MFTIDSIPIGKGVPASIVNEGFGINQLVYMLTVCLYSRYKIVAIEEPEIHLHPSMVRELAIALAEIAVEKDRRLIVSTHSETFVVALLSQIAAGKISADDVSFVHAENPNGSTVLTQQKANRNGQIEGGLRRVHGVGGERPRGLPGTFRRVGQGNVILVINEWIFHDLLSENGPEAYEATADFLRRLFQSDDRIVMPHEPRWRNKAYQLMTSTMPALRPLSQLFHRLLRDLDRCVIVNPEDISPPPGVGYDWAPPEDVYLIEAYIAANADLLVTTDETLFDKVAEHGQFNCQMRDAFLADYNPTGSNN